MVVALPFVLSELFCAIQCVRVLVVVLCLVLRGRVFMCELAVLCCMVACAPVMSKFAVLHM